MAAAEVTGEEKAREYRKGNWTLEETMSLIEAKSMDKERRTKRVAGGGGPSELRWKWVEDYCWKMGCHRSQNQCNDKWDNLMRDYKKVRSHETAAAAGGSTGGAGLSYWKLDSYGRKEKGLPSNFLLQIYEALSDVVETREEGRGEIAATDRPPAKETLPPAEPPLSLPQVLQGLGNNPTVNPSLNSDPTDRSVSPPRKRVRGRRGRKDGGGGVASAISKGAAVLAEALMAGEEKEETRHRELLEVKERRLRVERSRAETAAEAVAGLVAAVDRLAGSIRGARRLVDECNEHGKQ
ncbi:unnamed protein product [Spirodela intermedia]|uniref:Myb-like domain-containing protein n=1 Tax=Spirodela intermedia TaxID=51605 RepID=A0A7I8LIF6_SPIIN|nr:unnamed protein product [Spirodela intermedia]